METGEETFIESVEEPGQHEETPTGAVTPPATAASPDELKTAMAELAKTVGSLAKPKEEAKTLSDDEKNELWAVYNPEKSNPDFFKKWMRIAADADPNEVNTTIAERKALFAEMQQGLVRQSIVGARNLMQIELAKLREEFGPVSEYVSSAKAEKTREAFFTTYPALREENEDGQNKYQQVIDAVARTLADKTFPDQQTYFKVLAEGTAAAIKGLVPTFDLGAKTKTKPAVTSPRLPRTSVGGTGRTAAVVAATNDRANGASDDDSDSLDFMK